MCQFKLSVGQTIFNYVISGVCVLLAVFSKRWFFLSRSQHSTTFFRVTKNGVIGMVWALVPCTMIMFIGVSSTWYFLVFVFTLSLCRLVHTIQKQRSSTLFDDSVNWEDDDEQDNEKPLLNLHNNHYTSDSFNTHVEFNNLSELGGERSLKTHRQFWKIRKKGALSIIFITSSCVVLTGLVWLQLYHTRKNLYLVDGSGTTTSCSVEQDEIYSGLWVLVACNLMLKLVFTLSVLLMALDSFTYLISLTPVSSSSSSIFNRNRSIVSWAIVCLGLGGTLLIMDSSMLGNYTLSFLSRVCNFPLFGILLQAGLGCLLYSSLIIGHPNSVLFIPKLKKRASIILIPSTVFLVTCSCTFFAALSPILF